VVVTNQPDVPRGLIRRDAVEAIHVAMQNMLPIDDWRVCYHDDPDDCACRKPKPGMLYAAAVEREIQLDRSFMVGDRWRDIGAGRQAGCTTILVNAFQEPKRVEPDIELSDLPAAARWILRAGPDLRLV
jgi:D-glycero-D-manno-heptose 1,7-bisphosphate phosphatase